MITKLLLVTMLWLGFSPIALAGTCPVGTVWKQGQCTDLNN